MVIADKSGIPEGLPKSGRPWKTKQLSRSSAQNRCGILSHLRKTYDQRKNEKLQLVSMKSLETNMINEKKQKILDEKNRREERKKVKMANEYKSSLYQVINPSKLKTMSKKQLRLIKKTSVNKNGQVELVNPWQSS
mmetsp:Transcript_8849/g.7907  ORF Transcript_8849/g.7907 Transcript_8849/m.7907 type:complete len:136 (+) Transcript_8849:66-473(+)